MDFPSKKGNEMVVPNEDGSYTILINAGLNYESQLKAYEHAIRAKERSPEADHRQDYLRSQERFS